MARINPIAISAYRSYLFLSPANTSPFRTRNGDNERRGRVSRDGCYYSTPLERTIVVISFLSTFRDHPLIQSSRDARKTDGKKVTFLAFLHECSPLRSFRCRINVSSPFFFPSQATASYPSQRFTADEQ